jgi:chemotaxis protein CheY-P-specific phosphatase CheC
MQELTLEELKERIVAQMDGDALLEVLNIHMEDLVEALSDFIEANYVRIKQALPDEG